MGGRKDSRQTNLQGRATHGTVLTSKGKVQYLLKWKGWAEEESTWEPESFLTNVDKLLREFNENQKVCWPRLYLIVTGKSPRIKGS